jgi:N-succinyldiaminopimelate aminotransferase
MRDLPSQKLRGFGTTIFTEMTRLANEHGAVNLAQGFPDFDGPAFVLEAAREAIASGKGQYAPMTGLLPLREGIARTYRERFALGFDPESEVVVGCGATELIFGALAGMCDPGDEVILFEPFYDSYRASVVMAGAVPRVVPLRYPSFRFDPDELRSAFTPRTRVVLVNTPHNPTGRVFTREELETIASLCRERDVICLSDEVYEHLVYVGEHVPIATLSGMRERTLTVSGMSKSFSLTGWRVGWAVGPKELVAAVRMAHQFITFAAPTPLQWGAVAALEAKPGYYADLLSLYRQKRDRLSDALVEVGFDVVPAEGAYFVCAGHSRFGFSDDVSFARHLTTEVGVAAIPPSAFCVDPARGRDYVRFTFTKRDETLDAAIERLRRMRPTGA